MFGLFKQTERSKTLFWQKVGEILKNIDDILLFKWLIFTSLLTLAVFSTVECRDALVCRVSDDSL